MMSSKRHYLSSLTALLTLVIIGVGSVRADTIRARISPTTVSVGETARLEITVDGASPNQGSAEPSVPRIPGLQIEGSGRSSRMSIVNGAMSASTTFQYRVIPNREGTFTIDGMSVDSAPVNPVSLTVDNQSASQTPPRAPAFGTQAPTAAPTQKLKNSDIAFLRLRIPDKKLFAGQSIPITVRGYFRAGTGVTLTGMPEMNTDAFTISGLDTEPSQKRKTIKGQEFLEVTWRGLLTAIKSGSHKLSVTLPATVQYQEVRSQPRPSSRRQSLMEQMLADDPFASNFFGSSMFNDPFFDDPFFQGGLSGGGRIVTKNLNLVARGGVTEVAALPVDGRPDDFRGAVGTFELRAKVSPSELTTGEPATLDVTVSGKGNFAGLSEVSLADSPDWKAYSASSSFAPNGKTGFKGTKTFSQSIVPRSPGEVSLPAISLTYFDPETEEYVSKSAEPIVVNVAKGAGMAGGVQEPGPSSQIPSSPSSSSSNVASLAHGGVPVWWLWLALAALGAAVLTHLGWYLHRSKAVHGAKGRLTAQYQVWQHRREMKRAMRGADSQAFFTNARRAIQQRLGAAWNVNPESVTENEIVEKWPSATPRVLEVFRLADQVEYCHVALGDLDLEQWMKNFQEEFRSLPKSSSDTSPNLPTAKASS